MVISQYPTLNVAKLQSFKGQTPYEVRGDGQSTRLKFLRTDPLPLVSVRVNGGDEVTFFIDTGGSEVALDTEFARELGVPQFGTVQGTFSGGQHTEVQQGRIESLTVGDWTVRNLPVAMLPLRQLSQSLGAKRIDGIIGTTLFYHFLATLDFPRGELVLRRKNAANLQEFMASAGKSVAVPFWIASDHFMVGWGRVEALPPTLLFVDTGLSGAGVKLAESVIKEAGIKLEEDKASAGAGGGGTLKIVPYVVRRLSFGQVQEENVPGLYDGPFPWENMFGFHLAGMVGHDFFKPYAVTFDFENMKIVLAVGAPIRWLATVAGYLFSTTAIASTSTRKSGCERRRTSTVVLVGSAAKYSIRTPTCLKNSSMSVVKVWVRTRSASVAPAAARAAFRFSPTWRIWAPMSPLPTISPAWLRASRPETKTSFPATTVTTGE